MIVSRAPGRICLFGEHQDYLGLPVIAAAITRYITVTGAPNAFRHLEISLPDVGASRRLELGRRAEYVGERDYIGSGFNLAGQSLTQGYDIIVTGDIPQKAGCSSSSALTVAWVRWLLLASGDLRASVPLEVARLAHQAEVVEFKEPGGMMDHFAAAFGGIVYVDTKPPYSCEYIDAKLDGLILCYSGEPKATLKVLQRTREKYVDAREKQGRGEDLVAEDMLLLRAQESNAALTRRGYDAVVVGDMIEVGRLLTEHHQNLRTLGVSTERIDHLLAVAMEAGALGGKVNGSGGGGCLFVLAPGKEDEVIDAMNRAGSEAWRVEVAPRSDVAWASS